VVIGDKPENTIKEKDDEVSATAGKLVLTQPLLDYRIPGHYVGVERCLAVKQPKRGYHGKQRENRGSRHAPCNARNRDHRNGKTLRFRCLIGRILDRIKFQGG